VKKTCLSESGVTTLESMNLHNMDSCLRALFAKLFRRTVYHKVDSDEEIELIEHRYVVRDIYYKSHACTMNLSNVIMFQKDGIRINGAFIRYEYIPVIDRADHNVVILPTFTRIIDNKIVKGDYLSRIYIRFDSVTERESFSHNLFSKMVYVKESGKFDRSVFRFRNARKFMKK
tara:strand:+ start:184 stop:705 length:522 start_codon:yes stop_codon:yes gene_type:complete